MRQAVMSTKKTALAVAIGIALTLAARTAGTVMHTITGATLRTTLRLRTPAGYPRRGGTSPSNAIRQSRCGKSTPDTIAW